MLNAKVNFLHSHRLRLESYTIYCHANIKETLFQLSKYSEILEMGK